MRKRIHLAVSVAALGALPLLAGCPAEQAEGPEAPVLPSLRHERIIVGEVAYDIVHVDPAQHALTLHWKDPGGEAFGSFASLKKWLSERGRELLFAMNGGIYARDHTPLGLHVEEGDEFHELNRKEGGGNFFLKPNGVFYVDDAGAHILETEEYYELQPDARMAVQSGPLLLRGGNMHPAFREDSDSVHVRNGVGINAKGEAVFMISGWPVNFYTFASIFRDQLNCADALYLDGTLSGMYSPEAKRIDFGTRYVGIIAVSIAAGDADASNAHNGGGSDTGPPPNGEQDS